MSITIREIADAELSALLSLYAHLHPDGERLPPDEAAPLWETLRRDPNQHHLGAYQDGSLVSACTLVVVPNLTRGGRPYGLIENVVTTLTFGGAAWGRRSWSTPSKSPGNVAATR